MDLEAAKDRIYEAAVVPELWPDVLDMIAQIAGAAGTILIADDPRDPRWLNSPSLDGFLHDFMRGEWARVDSRMPKLLAAKRAGFLVEEDVYSAEEIARDPLIQDFLRPRGFGWATATFFSTRGGDNLIFSVERRYADGPVPRSAIRLLDRLRPHLGRAARLSGSAGLGRMRAGVDILADLGVPAGVVSRAARLTVVNERLKPLMPQVVRDLRERVAFAEPSADAKLARLLEARSPTAASIPIPADDGQSAYLAHVVPIRGVAHDLFSGGRYILVLTPALAPGTPSADVLEGLFRITAAEARVLRGLAEGKPVAQIAADHGVAVETVRSQIKHMSGKTGARRQAELVRLVSGLSFSP